MKTLEFRRILILVIVSLVLELLWTNGYLQALKDIERDIHASIKSTENKSEPTKESDERSSGNSTDQERANEQSVHEV